MTHFPFIQSHTYPYHLTGHTPTLHHLFSFLTRVQNPQEVPEKRIDDSALGTPSPRGLSSFRWHCLTEAGFVVVSTEDYIPMLVTRPNYDGSSPSRFLSPPRGVHMGAHPWRYLGLGSLVPFTFPHDIYQKDSWRWRPSTSCPCSRKKEEEEEQKNESASYKKPVPGSPTR